MKGLAAQQKRNMALHMNGVISPTSSSSNPLSSLLSSLSSSVSMPSAGSVLVWSGAAVAGYVLYEQLRFKWAKRTKDGKTLPGERERVCTC